MAVKLNRHDLEFILDQIRIAEAHVAGTPLVQLIAQPHLPYGLRTVDGSYNNLIEGRELWGAADQVMPRMLNPNYLNDGDGDTQDMGPVEMGAPQPVTNTDYGVVGAETNPFAPGGNGGHTGNVADADPRIISNLISDQTLRNPAAITAALQHAGYEDLANGVIEVRAHYQAYMAAIQGLDSDDPAVSAAKAALDQTLLDTYGIEMDGHSVLLPNVAPDEGLSAPFNGWMTFFGQFFDHGLDLIHKGNNGTIFVPLAADDPLRTHGPDGIADSGDEVPPHMAFMALTRLTPTMGPGEDGILGTADDTAEAQNKTTPFVDQNQTYTSHPSHQVFLREYEMVFSEAHGREVPLATGHLLDGSNGGLATWADVKAQAAEKLGIIMSDIDVLGVPLLLTDPYGEFIRGENGFPQVIVNIGPDLVPNTDDDIAVSWDGTTGNEVVLAELNGGLGPVRTSHQFLDDIAHTAAPFFDPATPSVLAADPDTGTDAYGNPVPFDPNTGANLYYDNELLDRHFITGDGRGNENIGLTAVHHVFHSEHNRQVEANKAHILEIASSGKAEDIAFLNEWLLTPVAAGFDENALQWDGERLFQTARFATEMQYQHLVFEEFGRKVQPLIDLFVFNTITDVNPAIFAEFAHTVYRFGHSMLTDHLTLLPLNAAGQPVAYDAEGNEIAVDIADWGVDVGLIDAFLNPILFDRDQSISAEQAAGAIMRGMSYVHGNEIDEFVVDSLRNNLLGLPLDLPAINIARGRDAGVPSLNEARAQLHAASNSSWLKPYESWADFGANLKTPASIINFIAAYGTHTSIVDADTLVEKRDAATALVLGGTGAPDDRFDFLNGTGLWAAIETGLNLIDLWIGGLAEKIMPFGGMLGSTFNAVFELQMENLQEGDRFYYLSRTQGLNLLNELENNAFSKLIMANTDLSQPGPDGIRGTEDDVITHHIGVDSFAKHDLVLEVDESRQIALDPQGDDPVLEAIRAKVQRDDPSTAAVETNYLRFTGGEHAVMGGTDQDDTIIGGDGDDAIWGGSGNDRIEGGHGVDLIIGGDGDDIITDAGDTGDFIKGEGGDDVIANSNGLDVVMGGDGQDVIIVGVDATEVFAGEGNDFILGGLDHDFILGNEGDDWIEGGDGFDVLNGDNSELFFNSTILGHDVMFAGENENDFDAESGDDIMVQGESVMRNEGMFGFDWAIHKGSPVAADSDMRIPIFTTVADDILRDRFDQTEGLSGWIHNDVLRGDDRGSTEEIEVEFSLENHGLTQAGINRIHGLRELLGDAVAAAPTDPDVDLESIVAWAEGNILLGGDGNDTFEGRGANDFIHGDAWLNVRISVRELDTGGNVTETEAFTVDSLKQMVTIDGQTKQLASFLLDGTVKPRQLTIVREILYAEDVSDDTDTAIFAGNRDWYEITHVGDRTYVARRESEDIDPQVDEGTDTLIGIERIQFADSMYTIRQTGNFDPTGRLVITGLPAQEDQTLTVHAANIGDLNNPDGKVAENAITYRWQIERNDGTGDYINIPGTSGNTFTPSDEHEGLRIRVLGTYVDAAGVTEIVSSQPTDPVLGVNDEPVGPLPISDMSPTEGQPLTATVAFTDPDGMTDAFEEFLLTYQWQSSANGVDGWVDVPAEAGGNQRTFVPGPEVVERHLRMVVVYQDDSLNTHTVISEVTEVVGNHIVTDQAVVSMAQGGDAEGGTTVGADWVEAGDGDNSISGGDGGDVLKGGGGNDTLNGDGGDDIITGGTGNDTIAAGTGNDTIVYATEDGNDAIDGGAGEDTLRVVQKTSGPDIDDTLQVTMSGGVVSQANGASLTSVEKLEADLAGGNDTLVYDTAEAVSVNLLSGAATGFSFTRGIENVTSGSGDDTLLGNIRDNLFDGREGNDTLRGGFGGDTLTGGEGNDQLWGEEGDDLLEGGAGDDRLDGGAGVDTASFASAPSAVTVSLAGLTSFEEQDTIGAGVDRLISIENLIGSDHDDTLIGSDGDNVIDGGTGADTMTGGLGDDTYVVDNVGDEPVEAADGGNDTVQSALASYQLDANIENLELVGTAFEGIGNGLDNRLTGNEADNYLRGAGGTDTVVLAGPVTDHQFTLEGGAFFIASDAGGKDRIQNIERADIEGRIYNFVRANNNNNPNPAQGGAEADLMLGFDGNDVLTSNGGDDILIGGNGDDVMRGGDGDDVYVVTEEGDVVDETGGSGIDTILSTVTRDLHPARVDYIEGDVENLTLLGTADIDGTGNGLDNVLIGNAGNNRLGGGNGNDTLIGNAGDDRLLGHSGDDMLEGGEGSDIINGGNGTDTAVFAGAAGDYAVDMLSNGNMTVTHLASGDVDRLINIEQVKFGGGQALAIVTDPAATPTGPSLILGTEAGETIVGSNGDDIIIGGPGDDTLNGYDLGDGDDDTVPLQMDDDTFIWRPGDGTDTINGGGEGINGDLFQIIGDATAETYRIYTYDEAVARIGFAGSDESEIVVTRQVEGEEETIIAELTEIEEIVVNGGGVSASGDFGGDTVEMYGSFDVSTSLRPDTITVIGSKGNDTVNISSLLSNHRIVFRGAGGNDIIIGALRPQDVIVLATGKTIADYIAVEHGDGSTSITSEDHTVTFWATDGLPQFTTQQPDDEDDETPDTDGQQPDGWDDHHDDDDDDNQNDDDQDDDDDDDDDDIDVAPSVSGPITGTADDDVLLGTSAADLILGMAGTDYIISGAGADVIRAGEGDDLVDAGAGRDIVFAGDGDDELFGGADDDVLYGEDGNDWLSGGAGNDLLDGGSGDDTVFGGEGDDMFIGRRDDGDDSYDGGAGIDTLDLGALNQAVEVDLGTGIGGRGSVTGAQSGTDMLYGIENVTTGSGNDTIIASNAVNIIDGGDGNDVFVFTSRAAADGDTIVGFETGDKIDLSGIDANTGASGVQSFTLVSGQANAPGQVAVSHESREDGDFTVVTGNTSGGDEPDFRIEIAGNHTLGSNDFNL
ncbi:peroxidase family protein [Pelagibacterium sediminicola]|uniref:peroxidase family protein n=1 Tax=Pelagibacterium sediminicola TaxID=2248761 RepID=UPI0024824E1B|nr:peroxidase family protein [Pelagibacterium sediminicola]